ncbi:MAG: hypothetical protein NVS2B12_18240 [Ktedonobacteraceae bacterium]
MHEDPPFDESELSAEDLAILHAFDAIESWEMNPAQTDQPAADSANSIWEGTASLDEPDDMLIIFLTEVEEDITAMQQVMKRLARGDATQPGHFAALRRLGHKIRGTSGAVGYLKMSEVASHVEIIAEQAIHAMIQPATAYEALTHTLKVLEFCLSELLRDNQEPADDVLIDDLRTIYANLSIDLDQPLSGDMPRTLATPSYPGNTPSAPGVPTPLPTPSEFPAEFQISPTPSTSLPPVQALRPTANGTQPLTAPLAPPVRQEFAAEPAFVRVAVHHFDNLIRHTEKLFEQHASMDNAYKQVEAAFQDLQAAQARFQRLEMLFSNSLAQERLSQLPESHTSSSLITRIFQNAATRNDPRRRRGKSDKTFVPTKSQPEWDELDMERYSEKDMQLRSLREAMADMASSSARLKAAYQTLYVIQVEYLARTTLVRNDTLLMRQAPLSTLMPQLRDVVMTSILAREQRLDFEITGDCVEIDQDVLTLLSPLLQTILETCTNNVTPSTPSKNRMQNGAQPQPYRVWLAARAISSEVALEVGFSREVPGGAMQTLREQIRLLNGTLALERNAAGGISFFLRFPRIRGVVQCLLVRVADQHLLIPLSHIRRVAYTAPDGADPLYQLRALLDLPAAHVEPGATQPVILMQALMEQAGGEQLKILIDEIIDEIELVVKPLESHLQRPGVTGSVIGQQGNVLLLLDIAELVASYKQNMAHQDPAYEAQGLARPLKILVADDSAYLRRSVLQTLQHTPYQVIEARDGLEALDLLKVEMPDVLLLDIEMPYLNGYDLLDIVRHNPRFSAIKIIMLTSRSSDKHMLRAMELGAHAYLIKPSPGEKLLTTIRELLPQYAP